MLAETAIIGNETHSNGKTSRRITRCLIASPQTPLCASARADALTHAMLTAELAPAGRLRLRDDTPRSQHARLELSQRAPHRQRPRDHNDANGHGRQRALNARRLHLLVIRDPSKAPSPSPAMKPKTCAAMSTRCNSLTSLRVFVTSSD